MKLLYGTILVLVISIGVSAQNYTRDAGIQLGNGVSCSFRQFYKEDLAMEIYGGYQERGLRIGAVREYFKPSLTRYSENIRMYFGYGVHTGFTVTNEHKVFNRVYKYDWIFSPVFGVDGIVGVEYRSPELPFLFAAQALPSFEFSRHRIFQVRVLNVSFVAKYRF